jgi:MFS family permease
MRKWLPLIVICTGTFMLLVDVTIVNVALPDLAAGLKTSFGSLQWVVDAYALTLAALVLGTGSIADKAGHRRTSSRAWWCSPCHHWPADCRRAPAC